MEYKIKPKQLRDALVMTGREYRETPECKEKAAKQWKKFLDSWKRGAQFKQFEEMAATINQRINQINDSGLPKMLKEIEERYASILENYKLFPKDKCTFLDRQIIEETPLTPAYNKPSFPTPELINEIAEKSAEKVMEKFKINFQQNPLAEIEKNPIKLPLKTTWEDIEIRFKNKFDVEIYCKGKFLKNSNHEELGFLRKNTKDKKPDKQWQFLELLAIVYSSKKITNAVARLDILANSLKIKKNACMKIKEGLSRKLQKAFGLTEDPFYDYKEKEEYQTRFTLKPEAELRGNGEVFITKTRYDDNKDYLN